MSLTNKLINPTPFLVNLPYEKGIELKIPADGELELTVEQMDDYRPGKPGSEEVKKLLNYHGLFLMDVDRSYDSQALQALEASCAEKERVIKDFQNRLQLNRTTANRPIDQATIDEITNNAGYGKNGLADAVELLKKRITKLKEVVKVDKTQGRIKEIYDPERTCYVLKPPKQFASKMAMAMYLDEHPEIKREHEKLNRAISSEA